jgi:hypothetical protein
MTGAEKISESEFRSILRADLAACRDAPETAAENRLLDRRRLELVLITLMAAACMALSVYLLMRREPMNWVLLGFVTVVFLLVLLVILRRSTQLDRLYRANHLRWQQSGLKGCGTGTIEFASGLAQLVLSYNSIVDRLDQMQQGDYWRDFRKLTDTEKEFMDSAFLQVRGQLLGSLQICRQILDQRSPQIAQTLKQQLVSREQEMIHDYTAKTMTSNSYLELVKHLGTIESKLQDQISKLIELEK